MAEWLKAAVLKTARLARVSGVRIPLPPPRYSFSYDSRVRPFFLAGYKEGPQVIPDTGRLVPPAQRPLTRSGEVGRKRS